MDLVWHSFMEAMTPSQRQLHQGHIGQCNQLVGSHPLTHHSAGSQVRGSHFRSSSKNWEIKVHPNVTWRKIAILTEVGQSESGSEEEFEDSREVLPSRDQFKPPSAPVLVPVPAEVTVSTGPMPSSSLGGPIPSGEVDANLVGEGFDDGTLNEDLIEDAKFYQDVALNYQKALLAQQVELQDKFKAQSCLMEEASVAIHTAETEAQQWHQELLQRTLARTPEGVGFCCEQASRTIQGSADFCSRQPVELGSRTQVGDPETAGENPCFGGVTWKSRSC